MSEPESMMQVRGEGTRGKGGKGKAIIKRTKTDESSVQQGAQQAPADSRRAETRKPEESVAAEEKRDPQVTAKIQQRAYVLFEASGFEHGHDVEHWLEAERQITGNSGRRER